MTKEEQRKAFVELREMCRNPEFEVIGGHMYSKGDEYSKICDTMMETQNLDIDYHAHLKGKNGYDLAAHPEKLTFKECCTALTFILRAEHWSDGAFAEALSDGSVYKLLSRMIETL